MDYNKLCDEILKLNPKIRYAGVYSSENEKFYEKIQKGITKYLDAEKTSNNFFHAFARWKSRQQDSDYIGDPIYSSAKYEKINRITLPCTPSSMLMITTEPELEAPDFIDDVLLLIAKHADVPNYTPKQTYMG